MSEVDKASVIEDPDAPKHVAPAPLDHENRPTVPDYVDKVKIKGWGERVQYDYEAFDRQKGISGSEFASNARRYEWSGEFGDVAPAIPELEAQLFGSDWINRPGEKLEELNQTVQMIESTDDVKAITKFEDAGLHPVMLENIKLCGYGAPTPVQAATIPAVKTGHDVIAIAQTGSGKTASYLIPTISMLMGKAKKLCSKRPGLANGFNSETDVVRAEPLILVVAPTRELATQIFDESRRLCYRSMLRPCVAYGGAPSRDQKDELRKGCDILIGTPGRLCDFLNDARLLSLKRLRYVVIDEADELLDSDWESEIGRLMSGGDSNEDADTHYLMFSATFNRELRAVARKFLSKDYVRVKVGRPGSVHCNVRQDVFYVSEEKKRQALLDLILSMPPCRTLIFVNSKRATDHLDDFLYNSGLPSTSFHSDRTQLERESALRAFRGGECPLMVATGVSARGLDVRSVMHVINFDLPSAMHGGITEYVHRIGRTARIGNMGLATSFYNDDSVDLSDALVKVLLETNQKIPDFLETYKPEEGTKLDFDDDTDDEADATAETGTGDKAGDNSWGGGPVTGVQASSTDSWGASGAQPVTAAAPKDENWATDNGSGGAGW